jgi:hypothetical protein
MSSVTKFGILAFTPKEPDLESNDSDLESKQPNRRYYHTPQLPQSFTHLQGPGGNTHDDSRNATELSLVADSSVVGSRGGGGSGRLGGAGASTARRRGRSGGRPSDGGDLGGCYAAERREDAVTMLGYIGYCTGCGIAYEFWAAAPAASTGMAMTEKRILVAKYVG